MKYHTLISEWSIEGVDYGFMSFGSRGERWILRSVIVNAKPGQPIH